nr:MAG TPA: hypothetical protein [Caudoviricetes sp.]
MIHLVISENISAQIACKSPVESEELRIKNWRYFHAGRKQDFITNNRYSRTFEGSF